MAGMIRDAVVAARRMWTSPVVSLAAVLTFALGIGANVAIFSVAWPVLFAPLPFPDEARLTLVTLTVERDDGTVRNPVSAGDYVDMLGAQSFGSMAAFNRHTRQFNLTGFGEAEQITVGYVTPELFPLLGAKPILGRLLQPSDADGGNVTVLNAKAWRSRFGADPGVLGRTFRFDGRPFEVVGVAPATVGLGTVDADAWLPQIIDRGNRSRGSYFLGIVARLRPGVSLEEANAELAAIMARAALEFPDFNRTVSARAEPFRDRVSGPVRPSLVLLLLSASMVLLISTINLTGLQRARDLGRSREMSVRRALGASRWHLARQALVEALTLSLVGGVLGAGIAFLIVSTLVVVAPAFGWQQQLPTSRLVVVVSTAVLTVVSGLAVGLWPAWQASRKAPAEMWQGRTMTTGRAQVRLRAGVVATQVALTAILLVAALLVAASQRNVLSLDPGFDPTAVRVANLNVPAGRFESVRELTRFFDTLTSRLEALPGVAGACVANDVPLDREPGWMTYVPEGTERRVSAWPNTITPRCKDVLRLTLRSGQWVTNSEIVPSIMVSASMARELFPDGRDAIGQRVHFGLPTQYLLTIIGVVEDIRDGSLEASHGRQVWMPQSLGHFPPSRVLVRYTSDAAVDDGALRAVVHDLAPDLALARPRSLEGIVVRATATRRFVLLLLSGFAGLAILLSAVGLYGLLAHTVGQRTQEIGIRLALGAQPGQVLRLLLSQVAFAVGIGIAAGLWGARALSGAITTLLYGITPTESTVYVTAAVTVMVITAVAVWSPSRRAIHIDPSAAMRTD